MATGFLISTCCLAQKDRKISACIAFNVNATQYDRTISNNATGFGAGLQVYMRTKTWVRPALDLSADVFGGTKLLYLTNDDKPIYAKDAITTLYAGAYFQPSRRFFAVLTGGPSFFNNHAYLGIKPGCGYYLLRSKQLAVKVCFTNVFQRDGISNQSFGYWNFSLAAKLF